MTVVDTDGEPLRRAVRAEPDVISPNVLEAEELVGHEFNDEEDRVIAVREMVALGSREAIMTMPDGCVARVLVDGARAPCTACRVEPREAVARSAPATRSWRATSRRATSGRRPRTACASASPAAPSRPSAWAPAWSTRARSTG